MQVPGAVNFGADDGVVVGDGAFFEKDALESVSRYGMADGGGPKGKKSQGSH